MDVNGEGKFYENSKNFEGGWVGVGGGRGGGGGGGEGSNQGLGWGR